MLLVSLSKQHVSVTRKVAESTPHGEMTWKCLSHLQTCWMVYYEKPRPKTINKSFCRSYFPREWVGYFVWIDAQSCWLIRWAQCRALIGRMNARNVWISEKISPRFSYAVWLFYYHGTMFMHRIQSSPNLSNNSIEKVSTHWHCYFVLVLLFLFMMNRSNFLAYNHGV